MLSHEEREQLSEIEAMLVADEPELHDFLTGRSPVPPSSRLERRRRPLLRTVVAVLVVVVLTAVVTLTAGPSLGGPVAVFGLCTAGMYGLNQFGSCPGRRARRSC